MIVVDDLTKTCKAIAVMLIVVVGVIHLIASTGAFEEAISYVGVLLLTAFAGSLSAAFGIFRDMLWGWMLGAMISGGALELYVESRMSGLPGYALHVGDWLDPLGFLSLVVEALFLAPALVMIARQP